MSINSVAPSFSLPFLQAVSDWQRGGDEKQNKRRGQVLKNACEALPEKYRTCSLCCFRQVALPKGGVWKLIGENHLPEKISSWTPDIEVAKALKGGVPPDGQGYQGVILCVFPQPSSVIVNLHELYQDQGFREALEQNKTSIVGFHDGAGRYGNAQSECVLEIASVTQEDVYSMGGHSSPFEQLVDEAAALIFGRPATPTERETLMLKTEKARSEAGPRWLSREATEAVLNRTKPHAKRLREVKRAQDAK